MNNSDRGETLRCFDIGGSKIVAADVSPAGQIQEIGRVKTPLTNFGEFCQALAELGADNHKPLGISVAGVVHPSSGLVKSANLPCISGRCLEGELSKHLSRPVHLINDANAFALAEAGFGMAREHEIVLAVILGTGIGGGIVVNGQILLGADGTAGEWGHSGATAIRTRADLPQLSCNCGQLSCVDTLGGARGLERLYTHFAAKGAEALDSHSIVAAWSEKNGLALKVVDVWLDIVAGSLAASVNLLGASIVAVGGGLANSAPLIVALDKEVRNRCLANFAEPLIYRAVSGPEKGLLGAAIHARSKMH